MHKRPSEEAGFVFSAATILPAKPRDRFTADDPRACGRADVGLRCVSAALFRSQGLRRNTQAQTFLAKLLPRLASMWAGLPVLRSQQPHPRSFGRVGPRRSGAWRGLGWECTVYAERWEAWCQTSHAWLPASLRPSNLSSRVEACRTQTKIRRPEIAEGIWNAMQSMQCTASGSTWRGLVCIEPERAGGQRTVYEGRTQGRVGSVKTHPLLRKGFGRRVGKEEGATTES